MKKLLLTLITPLLLITSCGETKNELSILCPTGAPSLCFYKYANEDNFITSSNPQNGIMPMFNKNIYDVIVAPTQGGLNQIVNNKVNYKIAATITFGNFYIVSTGTDTDSILNSGDRILIFQENDLPGKVFNYLYGDLNLFTYSVSNLAMTKSVIQNNGKLKDEVEMQFDYVFTSEPVVSTTNSTVYRNVQDDFKATTNGKLLTQASIFINNKADKILVNNLLEDLKTSIEMLLDDPTLFNTYLSLIGSPEAQQSKFGVTGDNAQLITENNNRFSLGFKYAIDIKNDIQQFIDLFPSLNLGVLDEEIFYK